MTKSDIIDILRHCLEPTPLKIEKAGLVGSIISQNLSSDLVKSKDIDIVIYVRADADREMLIAAIGDFSLKTGYLVHPIIIDHSNRDHFSDFNFHQGLLANIEYIFNRTMP